MHRRTGLIGAVAAASVVLAAGCSSSTKQPANAGGRGGATSSGPTLTGTVTVFAAASLKESFTTLAKQFELAHPGVTMKLNFGASSTLAQQINQGAPADVFASASVKNMTQVTDVGGASTPTTFVNNVMEIAVPPSNPANITALADLARPNVKVALCQAQVPCGAIAAKVFTNAELTVKAVTLESDVKATLTKVELNEVDAGLVYVTDVKAAGSKVKGIEIPPGVNASTQYPIAALTKAPNPKAAIAFTAYILSKDAQSVLTAAGFEKP
jgi:molybdate transport system substrate-binding protein